MVNSLFLIRTWYKKMVVGSSSIMITSTLMRVFFKYSDSLSFSNNFSNYSIKLMCAFKYALQKILQLLFITPVIFQDIDKPHQAGQRTTYFMRLDPSYFNQFFILKLKSFGLLKIAWIQ